MADPTLKALLDQHVQATVIDALSGAPDMIEALIKSTMTEPVDPTTGRKPDGYHASGRAVPWLEYVTGSVIRDAVKAAIIRSMVERQPELQAAVEAAIRTEEIASELARTLIDKADAAGESWRWNFEIKLFESEDQ